jgi:Sec7-like guanine-nucleotide exchange factor
MWAMKDLLKGMKFADVDIPAIRLERTNNYLTEMQNEVQKQKEREERYKFDVLDTLKRIERNTADLQNIVSLLQTTNQNQDELFKVVVEILSISKASTPEEADSKYRSVMTNIQTFNEDVETANKLWSLANVVWTMAKEYFKNPQ